MASQPDITGVWKVTIDNLQAFEPAAALASTLIVDGSQDFELGIDVAGSGVFWNLLEGIGLPFTVDYYAERFGAEPGEADLSQATVTMAVGGSPYTPTSPIGPPNQNTKLKVPANTLQAGVYRIMCMARWGVGITSFPDQAQELLIEVY